jgi:hypothetical protein
MESMPAHRCQTIKHFRGGFISARARARVRKRYIGVVILTKGGHAVLCPPYNLNLFARGPALGLVYVKVRVARCFLEFTR